jgi:hypothetical protein
MKNLSKKVLFAAILVMVTSGVALAWGGSDYGSGGRGGESGGPWTPSSDIGMRHIDMATNYGPATKDNCGGCHSATDYSGPMTPPSLSGFQYVDMGDNSACARCHGSNIFTAAMGASRCGDCHDVGGGGSHR